MSVWRFCLWNLQRFIIPKWGAHFVSWLFPLKLHFNVLLSFLWFLSFFIVCWVFSFLAFFSFNVSVFFLGTFVIIFLELASTMAEFACYCCACDKHSVPGLMFDIYLHPLLETDEVSGDVMIACQYYTFCCWRSLNMHMTRAGFKPLINSSVLWSGFSFL